MGKIRVAVLRGGPGHEYEVSLRSGESILKHLPEHYDGVDMLVDRNAVWHYRGLPIAPERIGHCADLVFNAMHGEYGEDGAVQLVLERAAIPFTGSNAFAAALGMNKALAKETFRRAGLKVPLSRLVVRGGDDFDFTAAARAAFRAAPPPWVVKPADRGSSVGVSLARNFEELLQALAECFRFSDKVLIEEYIKGREATVGVIDRFRGEDHYALPAIEIRRPAGLAVWTYDDKYNGATEEICPGGFTLAEKSELEKLAKLAHRALGLRHYSRSDFIISPRGIYLLETNSLPGLTSESLLPKALYAVGCAFPDFLDHVIRLALQK